MNESISEIMLPTPGLPDWILPMNRKLARLWPGRLEVANYQIVHQDSIDDLLTHPQLPPNDLRGIQASCSSPVGCALSTVQCTVYTHYTVYSGSNCGSLGTLTST